ncbi:hypothetical protein N7486_009718 [Penicillium sp. IBT 16267x]|nr:hypothetical protein N7486_009718 [Penicillium sp. IBT 16267x]
MSSYFSSLTSPSSISNVIGSRLNSLRRAITLNDEADDPENEDSSHISNALRAYYIEKGRPFPAWLPPDPKAPSASSSRVVATSQGQNPGGATSGRGGGLGDLWGDSGSSQPPAAQTTSLRRGRGAASVPPLTSSASSPAGPMGPVGPTTGAPLTHAQSTPVIPGSLHPAGARPLPSQRAGSYQSTQTRMNSGGSGGSAQERLRARLQGGRSPSPANLDLSVRKPVGERRW